MVNSLWRYQRFSSNAVAYTQHLLPPGFARLPALPSPLVEPCL